jgi:hypothetical protein
MQKETQNKRREEYPEWKEEWKRRETGERKHGRGLMEVGLHAMREMMRENRNTVDIGLRVGTLRKGPCKQRAQLENRLINGSWILREAVMGLI